MPEEYTQIEAYIEDRFDEHLERIRTLLQQPSVSLTTELDSPEVRRCAEMVRDDILELGAERAELVEFEEGYPVVFGILRSRDPEAKTLILYCFYDVMPADEPEWRVPPFAAEILDAEEIGVPAFFGKCLVARGANHPKGPLVAFMNALRSVQEVTGDIPVSVIFVIEGEEEIASRNLPEFRDRFMEELKEADGVYFPTPAQSLDEKGVHEFRLGYKGWIPIELKVEGGEWGGPTRTLGSADVAWVDAPAWRLVWALNTLLGPDGRVLIEGFYEDVREPTPEEVELLRAAKQEFDEEGKKTELGIARFKGGQPGEALFERYVMDPVLNIDGLVSGYTGPQIQTTLPKDAVAKITIKIVPNMKREDVLAKLRRHLDRHGFPEVQIDTYGGYPWSRTSPKADIVQAALRAADMHGVKSAPWPTYVYCAPFSLFTEPPLNLPSVAAGLGRKGKGHSANEYLTVDGIRLFEKWVVTFLHEYAGM